MKALVLAAYALLWAATTSAQSWQWMHQFSVTTGSVNIEYGVSDKIDNLFYGGTISGDVYLQNKKLLPGRFVIKLNPSGDIVWQKTYPYNYMRIIPDNLGGFYYLHDLNADFSSSTGFHSPINRQSFALMHYNNNGDEDWSKTGTGAILSNLTDFNGNLFLTGYNYSDSCLLGNELLQPTHYGSFFLYKISAAGKLDWVQRGIQQSNIHYFGLGRYLMFNKNGDIVVFGTGKANDSSYFGRLLLATVSTSGTLISHKWFGSDGYYSTAIHYMAMDDQDFIYSCAQSTYHYSPLSLSKSYPLFDSTKWAATLSDGYYNSCNYRWNPILTSDKGVVMAGTALSQNGYSVSCSPSFYECGSSNLVRGDQNFFLQKLNTNGECDWLISSRGLGWDKLSTLITDNDDNCYVTGSFSNTHFVSNFQPLTLGTYTLSNPDGKPGYFIAKYGKSTVGIKENNGKQISLFPNPASTSFEIRIYENGRLTLHNSLGIPVHTETVFAGQRCEINTGNLEQGLYIVELTLLNGAGSKSGKIIVRH